MKRYKQLATAGIALSTVGILAGCDHANNTTSGIALTNTANIPGDTSYAYEVVWNNHIYTVGQEINEVGSQIGTVHHYDVNPKSIENNGSNFFTVGAKLFSIPGKNTKDQIAA